MSVSQQSECRCQVVVEKMFAPRSISFARKGQVFILPFENNFCESVVVIIEIILSVGAESSRDIAEPPDH